MRGRKPLTSLEDQASELAEAGSDKLATPLQGMDLSPLSLDSGEVMQRDVTINDPSNNADPVVYSDPGALFKILQESGLEKSEGKALAKIFKQNKTFTSLEELLQVIRGNIAAGTAGQKRGSTQESAVSGTYGANDFEAAQPGGGTGVKLVSKGSQDPILASEGNDDAVPVDIFNAKYFGLVGTEGKAKNAMKEIRYLKILCDLAAKCGRVPVVVYFVPDPAHPPQALLELVAAVGSSALVVDFRQVAGGGAASNSAPEATTTTTTTTAPPPPNAPSGGGNEDTV